MTATTTNFAIPYPQSTDYVKDGASAIATVAQEVDTLLGSGSFLGSFRNLIHNGEMRVSQRAAGNAVTTTGYYGPDRWATLMNTLGGWNISRQATSGPTGFRNYVNIVCNTADASPAAADYIHYMQTFEGRNLQRILKGTASAKTLSLSFWVRSNKTGTYIVELRDSANTRTISKSYTINAAATWEFKTVTFAGDTTGTLANDSTGALALNFWLGAGSNYTSGTLQTSWGAQVNANRAVGQTNLAATMNNYWDMTGAQLEVSAEPTPFEYRDFTTDLFLCQRYFEKTYALDTVPGTNTANGMVYFSGTGNSLGLTFVPTPFKVPKRTDPTMTYYLQVGTAGFWDYARSGASGTVAMTSDNKTDMGVRSYNSATHGAIWAAVLMNGHWTADAEF